MIPPDGRPLLFHGLKPTEKSTPCPLGRFRAPGWSDPTNPTSECETIANDSSEFTRV
jgi:hypothetical protein